MLRVRALTFWTLPTHHDALLLLSRSRMAVLATGVVCVSVIAACGESSSPAGPSGTNTCAAGDNGKTGQAYTIKQVMTSTMASDHVKAMIVRVTQSGQNVFTGAMGDSVYGVPATADMQFRNGAMAFSYDATILLKMVDQHKVSLDDTVSKWFPNLPNASKVTLKDLAGMTSGYADYVYQPETLNDINTDPFTHFTDADLLRIGLSAPIQFDPGTNFGYSHTNYIILPEILAKIAGKPIQQVMQDYIFSPLHLSNTYTLLTPDMPQPVLHAYSSERRQAVGVPANAPFYEDATYWDPSWTTAEGTVQSQNICDWTASAAAIGSGSLLTTASRQTQTTPPNLGHSQAGCSACMMETSNRGYGLGVIRQGDWVTNNKSFAGSGAAYGYLPSSKLAIGVVTTYTAAAFDSEGNYPNGSVDVFNQLAKALSPGDAPGP